MTLLRLDGLGVSLGGRSVLDGVSLAIGRGELVGLIGPNGAGKSTLLRSAVGLVPSQGGIEIDGKDAARLTERERARTIAFLPQEREIAWPVTVARLVALGRAPHRAPFSLVGAHDAQAVAEAMRRADVTAFADRPATELSGGEKARVLIARALAQEAPLLLADEPTAGLDPAHQIGLMRVFGDLVRDGGSVVVSLHELGLAARWCTRLILLDRGRVVADGSPAEVLTRERLRDVYGIDAFLGEAGGGMVLHPLDLANLQSAR